ncbi:MAG: D-alanine--D-alanine ligase [Planctomycetes bacterium]|nr:D-alanine--D-alanine ligase [Planctomycetota bacterium]
MRIGLAFDLKADHEARAGGPDDLLEEYDSPATVAAIEAALRECGHEVELLGGGRRFVAALLERPPELVFNLAEGALTRSREAHVPAVCELLRVPCTHSDPLTLALTLDKALAKRVVASHGLATPRFAVIEHTRELDTLALGFPCIAKPLCEGSSIGIRNSSRAADRSALRREVERMLGDYRQPVLVEEFLTGTELTVGVLGSGNSARVLGMMEIGPRRAPAAEFVYSLESKRNWREEVEYHVPPRLPAAAIGAAHALALGCHRALGCRDLSRIDLRLDAHGAPHFLEANPLPGLNPETGDVVILARRSHMPYDELVARVVHEALARSGVRA